MAFTFRFPAICSLLFFLPGLVCAQTPAPAAEFLRLGDVDVEEVRSPQYDASASGMQSIRDGRLEWLQIKAEYATREKWTDEVTFTFYVALEGDPEDLPEGANARNAFSGTVTLLNIPQGNDHKVDMFLDPYTFARYGDLIAYAVVVEVNGELAAVEVKPVNTIQSRWWETQTPNAIPLLTRYESPYRMIEIDKQGTIQP